MQQRERAGRALSARAVLDAARSCGFPLAGLARAEPLDGRALRGWLAAGYAADMAWMGRDAEARLDPGRVLAGARTVLALALPYAHDEGPSPVARYPRGRDYHSTHRDRLKRPRPRLPGRAPGLVATSLTARGL